uniref:LOB domain-containing protein n=1 Tax=Nelumbo nucifera TaxID=4432 RepID=A0A822ZM04_NELNU|nr:TPA_asm: hypothetical protein HUJ06_002649 [Nelumbo nucifera]
MMSTSGRNASQSHSACAVCKHQRKKCEKDCPLAPYFPANRYQDFLNVHKLFGVGNIIKLLKDIEPHQRKAAVESILFEAKARKNDPVLGCSGIATRLMSQLDSYKRELQMVNQQLAYYRQREALQKQQQLQWLLASSLSQKIASSSSSSSQLFGSHYPTLFDLPIDTYLGGLRNLDQLAASCSTIDHQDIKPFDFKSFDQEIDAYFNKKLLTNNLEGFSTDSRLDDKHPVNNVPDEKPIVGAPPPTNVICKRQNQRLEN